VISATRINGRILPKLAPVLVLTSPRLRLMFLKSFILFPMSTGESSRVLEALNVLCNAPGELLRPHLAAVQKLQSRIEGHSTAIVAATGRHTPCPTTDDRSATPSSVSHHSSPNHLSPNGSVPLSLNREDPSALLRDQHASPQPPSPQPPPSSIEKFMRGLSNALERIKTCLSQERCEFFTSKPEWMGEDPRIVDIQIAGVTSKTTANHKFRRGLSQRSLAIEFDDWEINAYGISSTKERATNPSVQSIRKFGHIKEFLEANTRRFQNLGAARDGIEHGIKLLVCEMLVGGIGISAILIFRFSSLRALKYEELNDLKDAIEKQGSVKELAGQKADWLRQCQSEYDGKWLWLWLAFARLILLQHGTARSLDNLPLHRKSNDVVCLAHRVSINALSQAGRMVSFAVHGSHTKNSSRRPVSNPNSKNPNTNKVLFATGARAEDLNSPGICKWARLLLTRSLRAGLITPQTIKRYLHELLIPQRPHLSNRSNRINMNRIRNLQHHASPPCSTSSYLQILHTPSVIRSALVDVMAQQQTAEVRWR
jgi:hypothetical protein